MRVLARIARLIWGDDVDRALRPMLGVALVGSLAQSACWTFAGIWAVKELGATQAQLGFGYLIGALLSVAGGYGGGHLSDYVGRRPLILVGWSGQGVAPLGLLAAGHHVYVGLAVMASIGLVGSLAHGADSAMVADLVAPDRHEQAYAAMRVASNLGVTLGPPVGGALLLGDQWRVFFLGAACLGAIAWVVALRYLPRRGAYAAESPPTRGSFGVIRRDRAFLLFMCSSVLASMTYVSYETLLPISLTTSHGYRPAAWGFLLIVNPLMVTLLQLRLTRRVAHVPAALKLAVAMPLMGLPFLLLNVADAVPVVLLVLFLFVIGEMLWIPTSQSAVAAFAPIDVRGAYMGAFTGSWAVAWALGPFSGLQVRDAFGDSSMWMCVAALSLVAAVSGAAAVRGREVRARPAVASAP